MRKKYILLILLLSILVITAGCVSSPEEGNNTTTEGAEPGPDLDTSGGVPDAGGGSNNEEDSNSDNNISDFNISEEEKENKIKNISEEYDEYTEEELENESIETIQELERRSGLPYVCENTIGNIRPPNERDIIMDAPTFNASRIESMIHDSFNDIRDRREPLADPLKCDPKLRRIARQNSKSMILNGNYSARSEVADVCENAQITSGYWYYGRDMSTLGGKNMTNQVTQRIGNHNDLLTDVKNVYGRQRGYSRVSNPNSEIQGLGTYIEWDTGWTAITHIVC